MSTDDSGPAFPRLLMSTDEYTPLPWERDGMSLRQYAAIHLRAPNSGLPWLDEMIREANGDNLPISKFADFDKLFGVDMGGQDETVERTVTKPDYYDGEWHEWSGGECPVSDDTFVLIHQRGSPADLTPAPPADAWRYWWDHKGIGSDIIRFRVVKP